MKSVKEIVEQFGSANYKLYKGVEYLGEYTAERLIAEFADESVIEVGCCDGVIVTLLDLERMTVNQCRKYLNITQVQIQEALGVPIRTLQNWESGSRSCPEYVRKLVVAELLRRFK